MFALLMLMACGPKQKTTTKPAPLTDAQIFSAFPTFSARPGQVPSWVSSCCTAPQNPAELRPLARSGPISEPVGALFCDVNVKPTKHNGSSWDMMGGRPDPAVRLTLASSNQGQVRAKNTFHAAMSWPGLQLVAQTELAFHLEDRDLHRHDFIGSSQTTYRGTFPVSFGGTNVSISCLGIPQSTLEREAVPVILASLQKIEQDRKTPLNPQRSGWGLSSFAQQSTRSSVKKSASFVGWKHRWIGGLVAYHQQMLTERSNKIQQQIQSLLPTLDKQLGNEHLSARWVSQQCTEQSCTIQLELQSSKRQEITLGILANPLVFSELVFENGTDQRLRLTKILLNGKSQPTHKNLALRPNDRVQAHYKTNAVQGKKPIFIRGNWKQGKPFLLPLAN